MSSNIPTDLKYTKEHEWTRIDGDIAIIGITDFAQSQLGDIVFIELPEIGTQLNQNTVFGVVESIKSVSDLYAPLSGEVIEKNEELEATPELLNSGPYDAWMIKLKLTESEQISTLLNNNQYAELCSEN